jgi:hypothetical protein
VEHNEDSVEQQEQKELSVVESYAIVQPWAMMVHIQDTLVAS